MSVTIYCGDCIAVLRDMKARGENVQCCVTSPPYFGLRDYGVSGQIGSEATPDAFIAKMVDVFDAVREVLVDDGTLWLNLGDSYANAGASGPQGKTGDRATRTFTAENLGSGRNGLPAGFKAKDLMMIPHRVAMALQAAGWYVRMDVVWHKPNPMPESVTDRPTKSHEYIFLLSKNERYYYDAKAIFEPCSENTHARISQNVAAQIGSTRANGGAKTNGNLKAVVRGGVNPKAAVNEPGCKQNESFASAVCLPVIERNKRSVWTVPTAACKEAHFATFPPDLIRPCILAGCPAGGTVLDPFGGSGTTGLVAEQEGRHSVLIELNPAYVELAKRRTQQMGLLHSA